MRTKLEMRYLIFNLIVGLFAINCAFVISYYFSFSDALSDREATSIADYRNLLMIANLLYIIIGLRPAAYVKREFRNYSLFLISYLAMIVFLKGYEFSRIFHLYFLGLLLIFTVLWRYSNVVELLKDYFLPNSLARKVIVIGESYEPSIVQYINSRPGDFKCIGLLSESPPDDELRRQLDLNGISCGGLDQIEEILGGTIVDEVLISTSVLSPDKINAIMRITERYHTVTCVLPPYFQFLTTQTCQTEYWMGVPIISVFHSKLSVRFYRIAKRAIDVGFSLLFLIAVFPILCFIVAPAIWLSGRGPIFFKQLRKGYKQEPFLCYKFRTMKLGHKNEEAMQARVGDHRVTTVGKTLRKTSLDEVPQFINVLLGNMSIVGPRPHMVEHDEMYENLIERYNVRFVTKPGITGWAQVNGYRGSTEDDSLMAKRIEHDLWYIKNWSIWLDLKIILLTISSVLRGDKNAF